MTCALCDEPFASTLGFTQPEADLLCVVHMAKLLAHRKKKAVTWPKCANADCERAIYLPHCAATNTPRTICAWCALGRPVSIDVTTEIHPVSIQRGKVD